MNTVQPGRGRIVVIERGAVWPAMVFQGMADRDQVAVVAEESDETGATLWRRIARRAAALAMTEVSTSTVVLVCAQGRPERLLDRSHMARNLAALLAPSPDSRLVLTSEGPSHEMIVLAEAVLEQLNGSPVCVQVRPSDEPLTAQLAA